MKNFLEKIDLKILSKIFVFFIVLSIVLGFGSIAFTSEAANSELTYKTLTTIPGVTDAGTTAGSTTGYINKLFMFSIGMATVLAVLMITIGGFKYMAVESFSGKTDARDMITNAITGLITLLFAWVLLNEINPEILKFKSSITGGVKLGAPPKEESNSYNKPLTPVEQAQINQDQKNALGTAYEKAVQKINQEISVETEKIISDQKLTGENAERVRRDQQTKLISKLTQLREDWIKRGLINE